MNPLYSDTIKLMLKNCLIFLGFFVAFTITTASYAYADFSLAGNSIATGSATVAMPITDLQITGSGTEPIPVKLRVTSGTLAMSTVTGLTFNGSQTGSTIYFSGSMTNVNNALATLTYTRGATGTDTLEVSLVAQGEVFFTENNHLYKFISVSINADNALTAAAGQSAYGATGYLATITSQPENDFVAARLQGDGWMGASDAGVEGDWKWITGPEAGTSFWSGVANGHTVGSNYANWASGEPNQSGNEDCGQFYISSSKWNDLPCTGSNLAGYVVEFGAPGNMPSVAAKNIAINTVTNPTVSTLTPADGTTSVGVNTNLVVVFSKTVLKGTGNILIKKTADDTTVETIDVTSSSVTGENTNTITINPDLTFSEGTGYYIIIPATAVKDSLNNFYAGISASTTWNFTTGDFTNPLLSNISATSLTSTGVMIGWNTDENTSTRVIYGLTSSYGTNTAITDTSPRVTIHSVALSSLVACTTYHYAVVSTDNESNTTTSSDMTFTTSGCTANVTPTSEESNMITANTGGTTTLSESDSEISVQTQANFTDDASSVVIQIKALPNATILESLGHPVSVPNEVGNIIFDVKAIINGNTILDSFDAPITITYEYSDEDVQGLDEGSLWLYHYHNGAWEALNSCTNNTSTNTISCSTQSFSLFGLFGKPSTSGNSTSNTPSSCTSINTSITPDLFQADISDTTAKLYFTPLSNNVDNYFIIYGYTADEQRFGAFTGQGSSTGVLAYTIQDLNPNTTYYFKVRPHNGCSSGNWSNQIMITTTKKPASTNMYYKNVLTKILSIFPQKITSIGSTKPLITAKTLPFANKTCQSYTIRSGDTLWDIASQKLGSGSKYIEIMTKNSLDSTRLRTGQKLSVGCK